MHKLLRIDASTRSSDSVSRAVADPVPHLPGEVVPRSVGRHIDGGAARFQDTLVDELLAADAIVISTPMYNLGVPSVLKAWIDHVVLLGRTLVPGGTPPTAGVPVTIIAAFGGGYGPGTPREGWDHVRPYLETVFAGILGMGVGFVTVELTLAATTPGMEDLIDLADVSRSAGHASAIEQAEQAAALVTSGRSQPAVEAS